MIRINLLGVERQKAKAAFDPTRLTPLACAAVLVLAAAGCGWWYWSLTQETTRLAAKTTQAKKRAEALKTVLVEMQAVEQQNKQLNDRVKLIEQLRAGQSIPVQLLDHVSRSLPDMLWLTKLNQSGDSVTLEGRSTTLIALSDFVGNLGSNPLLRKPIEIVNSQVVEGQAGPGGAVAPDLISFTVKVQLVANPSAEPDSAEKKKGQV